MNTHKLSWSHGRHWFACVSVSVLFSFFRSWLGWAGRALPLGGGATISRTPACTPVAHFPVSKYLRTSSHIQSLPNCLFFSVVFKPFLVTFSVFSVGLHPSWILPTTLMCKPAHSVLYSLEPSLLDLILLSSPPVNLRLSASLETQEFRLLPVSSILEKFPHGSYSVF